MPFTASLKVILNLILCVIIQGIIANYSIIVCKTIFIKKFYTVGVANPLLDLFAIDIWADGNCDRMEFIGRSIAFYPPPPTASTLNPPPPPPSPSVYSALLRKTHLPIRCITVIDYKNYFFLSPC